MDIVILLCLVIFITYISISCILAYYFFKHRNIWNKCFEINIQHLLEYFECPVHALFWIPNIIPTSDNCSICKNEENENAHYAKQLETLGTVYTLFKQLDNSVSSKHKMFMWLIEGSIKDYEMIKNAQNNIYYKLKETYIETSNHKHTNELDSIDILEVENITYLENNIETLGEIIKCIERYIKEYIYADTADTNVANECNYLTTLFIDILDYSRITTLKIQLKSN
jgi:hypothetical protein